MKHIKYFLFGTVATLLFTLVLTGIAKGIMYLNLGDFIAYVVSPILIIVGFYTVGKLILEKDDQRKTKTKPCT